MAATIKTKIRTTTGGTPSTTAGELCVNTADKKIFIGNGAASVDLFGNLATTAGKLSQFAATTSAELAGVISDETGSGSLVFGTSPSISTLEISTTGGSSKTAAINMASGVTAARTVSSTITLNAYSADFFSSPSVPFTKTGYISTTHSGDLILGSVYSGSQILLDNGVIYIGDIDQNNGGTMITVNSAGSSVDIAGKLKPDQLVWENDGMVELAQPGQCPIYMKRWNSQEDDPVVYTYPFYVDWAGTVTASAVITPYLSSENGVIDINGVTLNLNGHNILPLTSVVTTAAALTNVSTAQNAFPVGQQTLTVAEDTTYLIEGEYVVNSGTTTHTTAIGFTVGGDVLSLSGLEFSAVLWSAAASTITTALSSIHVTANANTQTVLNATSTAAVTTIQIKGIWNNTTNTTITPKIKFSAAPGGTNQMAAGSYIRFTPVANPTVGSWA